MGVKVPVTTLCPCSKAISAQGAHNQRGIVRVKLQNTAFFWIEDIIQVIEKSASSAVYAVLKREDEKFVTVGIDEVKSFKSKKNRNESHE